MTLPLCLQPNESEKLKLSLAVQVLKYCLFCKQTAANDSCHVGKITHASPFITSEMMTNSGWDHSGTSWPFLPAQTYPFPPGPLGLPAAILLSSS